MPKPYTVPPFLSALLHARSPSGYETEAHAVFDRYVKPAADAYENDALGNRRATLNPKGDPVLMLAGHLDELGLIITYINKDGFLYFDTIGGHDLSVISGRRVVIQTANGIVKGVTGKRAIHLMDEEDRKKVPKRHEIWIDIGVRSKAEALERVAIGDVATYDHELELINGSIGAARAFDNKVGAYIVGETLIRLAKANKKLAAKVVAVGTSQEEIGVRGATTAAYAVNPHVAIAIDVGHATDHPDCDHRKFGETTLGGGPILCRGANINPKVYQKLLAAAKRVKIPHQFEADPRPTGTDARAIQMGRGGVATGLVSIPLRYMHTPSEVVDLEDVERCVQLLVEFAQMIGPRESFNW
ncbi:M20/M25/M40 family metallo-hydrolase [Opitutus terrae]|uniref:Peptidase M42 family protein n=1 Tax=Opitutus terrae (strain DSM 11246 / JCM 15787 / PB90-1) TaxID=452637 RepID=B1ZW11_OPITP|nr:M20/M25/M40 family metallo-hydrolase [Opitutus terrae]ACB76025.1 peptidase M42 family protein [Opitutus terrae PB90-1]